MRKNQKLDKSQVDPMVLIEVNLDEIDDKIRDTKTRVLQKFEQQYMQTLGSIENDLRE